MALTTQLVIDEELCKNCNLYTPIETCGDERAETLTAIWTGLPKEEKKAE